MKVKIVILIATLFTLQGCEKFVDVKPQTLLPTATLFENEQTASAAILGIYAQMCDRGPLPAYLPFSTGLYGDELTNYSTNIITQQIYNNSFQALDGYPNSNFWTFGYNYIYQANVIMEGISQAKTISDAVKKQLTGEALFIRAFWHFHLVNLYGGVPIALTTDYETNAKLTRSSVTDVYQQIVKDLEIAKSLISDTYVNSSSTGSVTDRFRPNKAAVTALLARTYLYAGDFAKAEAAATEVIGNSNYVLEDVTTSFLTSSKEAIWQLPKPAPNNAVNTWEGVWFILTIRPQNGNNATSAVSVDLLNAFDPADKRKSNWIGKYTDKTVVPNIDYYFPNKYKVFNSATISEHSIVLRLAEIYLVRAEARAKQSKLALAIADIDKIRMRAGLPLIQTTNPSINQADLLTAIIKERRLELFAEWGHRWFDIKRLGIVNAIMTNAAAAKGGVWSDYRQLWPIPQADILKNPNLVQNPGY